MDRDKAIDKIKKCLALASSSNPHEAASAMRQAQKLMAEHGLSGIDVELADVSETAVRANSNVLSNWETTLARTVADAFGCQLIVNRRHQVQFMAAPLKITDWKFIGTGAGPDVAGYAFRVLQQQCVKDRLAHVKAQPKRIKNSTRIARGDAFAVGWVGAVRDLLDCFAGNERQTEVLLTYMAHHYPDLADAKVHSRELSRHVRDSSFADGAEAGKNARLNRGIGAGRRQELLE